MRPTALEEKSLRPLSANFSAAVAAGIMTFSATPALIAALKHKGVIDIPNARSSHTVPTPRGGGLACLAGGAMGLWVANRRGQKVPVRLPLSATGLAIVGLLDDRYGLSPQVRLGAQVIIGALGSNRSTPERIVGMAITPVVVNSVNFMDGINGMTAMTTSGWGSSMLILGSLEHDDRALAVVGATAIGFSAGFLPWNAPEAKVFLGDVGSYFIGGMISGTALSDSPKGAGLEFARVSLVLAPLIPYFADTGIALVRKAISGQPLTEAHRDHLYQRLVSRSGMSHIAVSSCYSVAAVVCGLGLAMVSPILSRSDPK